MHTILYFPNVSECKEKVNYDFAKLLQFHFQQALAKPCIYLSKPVKITKKLQGLYS